MRYCNQCGRPIRDGEICSCQGGNKSIPRPTPTPPSPIPPRPIVDPMQKSFLQHLLSLFTNPVEGIQDMVSAGDSMMGVKLLLLNVIVTVIAMAVMIAPIQDAASGLFGNLLDRVGMLTIIVTVIGNLIICTTLTVLVLFFSKIVFHAQTSFMELFVIIESKAVLDGFILLLYTVLLSVSYQLAFLIFILGQVYSLLVMIFSYAEVVELKASKKVFSLLLTFVTIIVILYAMIVSSVNSVKRSAQDQLNSFNSWGQYFESDSYVDEYDDEY